jgi:drug/metabolite transporter (DMT)-like permease
VIELKKSVSTKRVSLKRLIGVLLLAIGCLTLVWMYIDAIILGGRGWIFTSQFGSIPTIPIVCLVGFLTAGIGLSLMTMSIKRTKINFY